MENLTRREFIKSIAAGGAALGLGNTLVAASFPHQLYALERPVVSIVTIKKDNVDYAVRKAIDLLGGIKTVATGKERIMLKPNLVSLAPTDVTKPSVVKALAQLMKDAGKDVSIGEGSAAAYQNIRPGVRGGVCQTKDRATLDSLQESIFEGLEYTEMASSLKIPLINLHTGDMATIKTPDGFVFKEISLHHSLAETDLLCSVPMMKTHGLATVTLGMKNLFGVYPGQVYGTVRSAVHAEAAKVEGSGTASAVVDMVRVNKLGLVVIDASMAMEGQGPSAMGGGRLVKMDLIIAGTNPLATDMVGASVMGFAPEEISTFVWAWKAGMTPGRLDEIEIRGERLTDVSRKFTRPRIIPYSDMKWYGPPC